MRSGRARSRPVLRLHETAVKTWLSTATDPEGVAQGALEGLRRWALDEEDEDPAILLETIAGVVTLPNWTLDLCRTLARDGKRRIVRAKIMSVLWEADLYNSSMKKPSRTSVTWMTARL
jgi:hypothetical protein